MYDPENEKTLVLAAQAGDRDAFGQLYDAILPGLYGYVRSRVPHTVDAEDLVSDVFLVIVQKLAKFRWQYPGSFRAWAFQIARRKVVDFYRRKPLLVDGVDEDEPLPDSSSLVPEMQILQREMQAGMLRLVGKLSPRKQEVVLLRFYGGLRNNEIAAVLNLNERTVSAHLSRALNELQAELARETTNLFLTREHNYD